MKRIISGDKLVLAAEDGSSEATGSYKQWSEVTGEHSGSDITATLKDNYHYAFHGYSLSTYNKEFSESATEYGSRSCSEKNGGDRLTCEE